MEKRISMYCKIIDYIRNVTPIEQREKIYKSGVRSSIDVRMIYNQMYKYE